MKKPHHLKTRNTTLSDLKILSISDIHLGHARNSTSRILNNLNKILKDDFVLSTTDIIFLCGDVFDKLGLFNSDDSHAIINWISSFLGRCKKHNIMLRVLEGTPSHDRRLPKWFISLNKKINADVKYFDKIAIEHIAKFNIDVLYIPDEINPDLNKVYLDVIDILKVNHLDQVDFIIMHGYFDFQLPKNINLRAHDSSLYSKLAKECIFVGHNHIYTQHLNIYGQGSFDRLKHGEEHPKGCICLEYNSVGEKTFKFIENENALKFITIECNGLSLEDTLKLIDSKVSLIEDGSFVRISGELTHPIFTNMKALSVNYPDINFSKNIINSNKIETYNSIIDEDEKYLPINIDKENIISLVNDRLLFNKIDPSLINRSIHILKENL